LRPDIAVNTLLTVNTLHNAYKNVVLGGRDGGNVLTPEQFCHEPVDKIAVIVDTDKMQIIVYMHTNGMHADGKVFIPDHDTPK
jgi:hypothetical protein